MRTPTPDRAPAARMSLAGVSGFLTALADARPDAETELAFVDPYTLLIAVVLSAQATDASVNKATIGLFAAAPDPASMVRLGVDGVAAHIRTIGLWQGKARNVVALSERLLRHHAGDVPRDRGALELLPGVGRKTANVVLNVAFGEATMAVDTHVFRLGNRTGLAPGKTPREVEDGLTRRIPPDMLRSAHHRLILHGRYVCKARRPECWHCVAEPWCRYRHKELLAPSKPMPKRSNAGRAIAAALTILSGVAGFVAESTPAAAADAYIRLNQLGAATGSAVRAYLVGFPADATANFQVRDAAGHSVFQAKVGATTGRWAAFSIYPLDFPGGGGGRYTITVTGPHSVISAPFTEADPETLYRAPLARALAFFGDQRDGADFIASALRTAPAHLKDQSALVFATPALVHGLVAGNLVPTGETIDASGGWWDAGDYLKFVETHSYTVGMLLTGLRDFPQQMGPHSFADFTAEAKFGLTWLMKMWHDPSRTLYYEVGIGIDFQHRTLLSDHDLWRLPQGDDTLGLGNPDYTYIRHRPVFAAGAGGAPISPNLAGRMSAAFALGFLQYASSDPAFAQACLVAAEHIFDLADTHPARLLTALPYGFYPEAEWRDDLEWGATELNLALALGGAAVPAGLPHSDPAYYLSQAAYWAHAYINGPNDAADTLNLYDVSGLAHFDLGRAIALAGYPVGLAVSPAELQADILRQLTHATGQAGRDPFRFGFPWTTADTTSHGAGLSVMAHEYAWLTGDAAWAIQATRWLDNIMGENIWGLSLIVGDGTDFPKCLQHQVANIAGSLSGAGAVLAGAAVEGPNATAAVSHGFLGGMRACPPGGGDPYRRFTGNGARFWDNEQNYPNTEPAIDLTASSPLMFAWQIAGAPKSLAIAKKQ